MGPRNCLIERSNKVQVKKVNEGSRNVLEALHLTRTPCINRKVIKKEIYNTLFHFVAPDTLLLDPLLPYTLRHPILTLIPPLLIHPQGVEPRNSV